MTLNQAPPMPQAVRPIVSIGAGAIVEFAHWPAYKQAGFPVVGVMDADQNRAAALAKRFGVRSIWASVGEAAAAAPRDAVFDIAVPAGALDEVLAQIPVGGAVLIQKPFGERLEHSRRLMDLIRDRQLVAAVNFQLRFAPYALAAKSVIEQRLIGDITEIDVKVNVNTPWHLWHFLELAPRMEIVYHSIHYVDLIRSFLGEPSRVLASTMKHPRSPKLHSSRSAIVMEFGDMQRATVITNHGHAYGPKHQESYVRIEGTSGCLKFQMGLNIAYPEGAADYLEVWLPEAGDWRTVQLTGSWFPDAFIGTMASLMCHLEDPAFVMPTRVEDAMLTMELVEACYASAGKL